MIAFLLVDSSARGECLAEDTPWEMVLALQARGLLVSYEGDVAADPVVLTEVLPGSGQAAAALRRAGCRGCGALKQESLEGGHVVLRGPAASLLDTVVALRPGTRPLTEVTTELEEALRGAGSEVNWVRASLHPDTQVVVPARPAMSIRSWLVALELENAENDLVWTSLEQPGLAALRLGMASRTPLPPSPDGPWARLDQARDAARRGDLGDEVQRMLDQQEAILVERRVGCPTP